MTMYDRIPPQVSSSVFNVSKVFSNLLLNRGSSPLPTRDRRHPTSSSSAAAPARSHSTGSSTPTSSIKKVFKKRSV